MTDYHLIRGKMGLNQSTSPPPTSCICIPRLDRCGKHLGLDLGDGSVEGGTRRDRQTPLRSPLRNRNLIRMRVVGNGEGDLPSVKFLVSTMSKKKNASTGVMRHY